jgi:hypothetical protein
VNGLALRERANHKHANGAGTITLTALILDPYAFIPPETPSTVFSRCDQEHDHVTSLHHAHGPYPLSLCLYPFLNPPNPVDYEKFRQVRPDINPKRRTIVSDLPHEF